jgi:hypothetical protein
MSRTLYYKRPIRGLPVATRDYKNKILLVLIVRNKIELLFIAWLTFWIYRIGVFRDSFNSSFNINNTLLSNVLLYTLGIPSLTSFRVVSNMFTLARTLRSKT